MNPQDQTHQNSATLHATGPWKVRAIRGAAGRSKRVWVESGDAVIIAEVYSGIGLFGKQPSALLKEEIDESKDANARLIAGAPDLLEACKRLVNNFLDASRDFEARDMALTAICKAQSAQGSGERAGKIKCGNT